MGAILYSGQIYSGKVLLRLLRPGILRPGATTVRRICAWARFWDAAHDGSIVGEDPKKPNAGRDGTQHHLHQ